MDQRYGYELVRAIRSGNVPAEVAHLEIGPACHSRWLTTANRFLRLWVSRHGFKGETNRKLRLIVEYVVGVYYPTWFAYKVRNNWIEGPRICLQQLQLTLQQSREVVDSVFPHLESSAWWAHPEMLLQSLLCSETREDRRFAVQVILQEREQQAGSPTAGDAVIRTRHKVHLNRKATELRELSTGSGRDKRSPSLSLF